MAEAGVERPSIAGSVALVLACVAVGFALLAAPGGLSWLPWIEVHDQSSGTNLAGLMALPSAVMSWVLALGSVAVAVIALAQRRGGRRSVAALALASPGAVLGAVVVGFLAVQVGTAIGVFPDGADISRQRDAHAVASHLGLPSNGERLLGQCEARESVFGEARTLAVVEPWSQARVEQIKIRLQAYKLVTSYDPLSPSDRSKIKFQGIDTRGNSVSVNVERFPGETTRVLLCATVQSTNDVMRTTIRVTSN